MHAQDSTTGSLEVRIVFLFLLEVFPYKQWALFESFGKMRRKKIWATPTIQYF